MSRVRRTAALIVAAAVCSLIAGCSTLPTSGPVHVQASGSSRSDSSGVFSPPGPGSDASPRKIASGFLTAMQAVPLSTSVARTFLTSAARNRWTPAKSTIVYDFATYSTSGDTVRVRLANVHRLDARGGWPADVSGGAEDVDLRFVQENGQWRIANPPDALLAPASYFQNQFAPYDLYFYDRTGTNLVPETVYLPRAEPTATNLVRALLAGPGARVRDVVRSAFPLRTDLDISVGVSDAGVAEVPLSDDVRGLSPEQLHRAFAQLARTLGQVPGINRVRVTVDRAPVPLSNTQGDVSVDFGGEYDPESRGASVPLAVLRDGRLQNLEDGGLVAAGGPLGQPGFSLRSVAQNARGDNAAVVATNGRSMFTAPLSGPASPSRVRRVLTGTNLLRPDYDSFGELWAIDATPAGARVHIVHDGEPRTVRVPGLSGADVRAFSVSQDGTRLVAALASTGGPALREAKILRADDGAVRKVTAAQTLTVYEPDLGPAVDVGWRTPSEVALLTQSGSGQVRATFLQADGSPGNGSPKTTETVAADDPALVVPPSHQQPLMLVDRGERAYRLRDLSSWVRAAFTGVTGGSYG